MNSVFNNQSYWIGYRGIQLPLSRLVFYGEVIGDRRKLLRRNVLDQVFRRAYFQVRVEAVKLAKLQMEAERGTIVFGNAPLKFIQTVDQLFADQCHRRFNRGPGVDLDFSRRQYVLLVSSRWR